LQVCLAFRPLAVNAATAAPATARDAVWLLCAASSSTLKQRQKVSNKPPVVSLKYHVIHDLRATPFS